MPAPLGNPQIGDMQSLPASQLDSQPSLSARPSALLLRAAHKGPSVLTFLRHANCDGMLGCLVDFLFFLFPVTLELVMVAAPLGGHDVL